MNATTIASIIVAIVAATSAYASQRAAAKATTMNTNTVSRVDMEKDAYQRARDFDTETIRRQDEEIEELRKLNRDLQEELTMTKTELRGMKQEMQNCKQRLLKLEERGNS
jgi:peptidoglycan hydrolase CwlO-like protein